MVFPDALLEALGHERHRSGGRPDQKVKEAPTTAST